MPKSLVIAILLITTFYTEQIYDLRIFMKYHFKIYLDICNRFSFNNYFLS